MTKFHHLISLVLLVVGCKGTQTAPSTTRSRPTIEPVHYPEWVLEKPVLPGYYVGIGNAYLSDPDHLASAKTEALNDLASEISVRIQSNSLLSQVESQRGFNEYYQSHIQSTTSQEIASYEVVSSWTGDRQHWVYYRLNRAEYLRMKKEKKDAALQIAGDYFKRGRKNELHDPVLSVRYYAQAIESLQDYLNEPNEVTIEGNVVLLANESLASIKRMLSEWTLHVPERAGSFTAQEKRKKIDIRVWNTKHNVPVKRLPVLVTSKKGKQTKFTGDDGVLSLITSRNEALGKKVSRVSVSLQFLKPYPVAYELVKGLAVSSTEIHYFVPPPTFYISSEEKNLESPLTKRLLKPFFTKLLTDAGAQLTDKNESEYVLMIASDTRKGTETLGLFSTYLDITIAIKDRKSNTVFSDAFQDVKGLHQSYEKAGINAYKKVNQELFNPIKNTLSINFFDKN